MGYGVRQFSCWFMVLFLYAEMSCAAIHLELLGEVRLPTGLKFKNSEVGGLSAISYFPEKMVYYALSDDRSQRQPARYYTLTLDGPPWEGTNNPVKIEGVTFLLAGTGVPFCSGSVDPEGIVVTRTGEIMVSSEGVAKNGISPFIALYNSEGKQLRELHLPKSFLPSADGTQGVRDNLGLEALALSIDEKLVITASENALVQDGVKATPETSSPSRLLVLDIGTGHPVAENIYSVDPVPETPHPKGAFSVHGLAELLALPWEENGYFALERAYAKGKGMNIRLYHTTIEPRGDSGERLLLSKELVLNFDDLKIALDNLEGMTFGPLLSDGRRSLVVISDNNFSKDQFTQILIFALSEDV